MICIDTVGSPNLLALEGEGMVWMNEYPKDLLAEVQRSRVANWASPSCPTSGCATPPTA